MIWLFLLFVLFTSDVYAQHISNPPGILIEEEDGSPAARFRKIKVSNTTLTNNGDGSASIVTGGGGGTISDAVYGAGWNGDTTVAPSKNAVYDKIETISAVGWTDNGTNVVTTTITDSVGIGTTTPVTNTILTIGTDNVHIGVGGTNNNATAIGELYVQGDIEADGTAYFPTVQVTDDSYAAGWDGSVVVPTKNAVYDKIETLGASSGGWTDEGVLIHPTNVSDNVGIGTTSPTVKLEVLGTVLATQFQTAPSNTPQSNFNPILAGDTHFGIGINSNGGGDNNDPLVIFEGTDITASHRVSVYPGGNVGIGTDNPVNKLEINGTGQMTGFKLPTGAASGYLLTSNSVGIGTWTPPGVGGGSYTDAQAQAAAGWTDGGTNVYLGTITDNVGIGTTTPSTTLEIVKVGSQKPLMISSVFTGDGDYLSVTSSGLVGIGTHTPSKILQIKSVDTDVIYESTTDTNTKNDALNTVAEMEFGVLGTGDAPPGGAGTINVVSADPLIFGTTDTARMSIADGGNVGIGTARSWASPFEVRNTTNNIWSVVDGTDNVACNTTCVSACVAGFGNATGTAITNILACSDATADICLCAGSN